MGCTCTTHPLQLKLGPCGEVLDKSNKPYLGTDKDHCGMACKGRGEVLIRGKAVSTGYFKQVCLSQTPHNILPNGFRRLGSDRGITQDQHYVGIRSLRKTIFSSHRAAPRRSVPLLYEGDRSQSRRLAQRGAAT